jgi:hypothetical protein
LFVKVELVFHSLPPLCKLTLIITVAYPLQQRVETPL